MEDELILNLYFDRNEDAINQTRVKYSRLLHSVAFGILKNHEDSEECENDTYLKAWNTIPPTRPDVLSAFLSRITRNLSLDLYEKMHAVKRGGNEVPLILDELAEVIPYEGMDSEDESQGEELKKILDDFLSELTPDARLIFMRRYWFGDSVQEVADKLHFGKSKVKMSLLRSRESLKIKLEKEGYVL